MLRKLEFLKLRISKLAFIVFFSIDETNAMEAVQKHKWLGTPKDSLFVYNN